MRTRRKIGPRLSNDYNSFSNHLFTIIFINVVVYIMLLDN